MNVKLLFLMPTVFLINWLSSCSNETVQQVDRLIGCREDYKIRFSFPKGSGVLVDWQVFEVVNDTLFEINATRTGLISPNDEQFEYDTIAKLKISSSLRCELTETIKAIDSLGNHYPRKDLTSFAMGGPRFSIRITYNKKEMKGYVANCYREHIFNVIDIMNKCDPRGNILEYDKEELIRLEQTILEK